MAPKAAARPKSNSKPKASPFPKQPVHQAQIASGDLGETTSPSKPSKPGLRSLSATAGGRKTPEKSLGEFGDLSSGYEGGYRPARVNLRQALEAGKLRNPLNMQQRTPLWSSDGREQEERPGSAGSITSHQEGRPQSRSGQRGHVEGKKATGMGALQPQRIELPSYLNTPARHPDKVPMAPEDRTQTIRKLQDLELLTFACRRANKVREEGRAHFSMGVLHDNMGHYEKAIKSYANFLKVCKECHDLQGCALAYHCLGVDYQILGTGDPSKKETLRKSLYFHNKHRESSDSVGKFVAHLNMGIAYAELGEREASTVNHQYALRYALQLHSLEGQSLAIGNLGFSAGMYENDPEKMRILIERYVELCDTLKQTNNQTNAYKKLGSLASQQGNYEQSLDYFSQAVECAKTQGDKDAEKACRVQLGIAAGQAKMAEHMNSILQRSIVEQNGGGDYSTPRF